MTSLYIAINDINTSGTTDMPIRYTYGNEIFTSGVDAGQIKETPSRGTSPPSATGTVLNKDTKLPSQLDSWEAGTEIKTIYIQLASPTPTSGCTGGFIKSTKTGSSISFGIGSVSTTFGDFRSTNTAIVDTEKFDLNYEVYVQFTT